MTCIVALVQDEKMYMGFDSAALADCQIITRKDKKAFKKGKFLIGFTDSYRMGQLLRFDFEIPKQTCSDDHHFMCSYFVKSLRECLSSGGYLEKKNEVEMGGQFLVCYKSNIYLIDSDFSVGIMDNFMSVGCGADIALGSLFSTTKNYGPDVPENRVILALKAAAEFNCGVRGPFEMLEMGTPVSVVKHQVEEEDEISL